MTTLEFEVSNPSRLDFALRNEANLSVSEAKKLIKEGGLQVNGFPVKKPSFKVRTGDCICYKMKEGVRKEKSEEKVDAGLRFLILIEDEHLIAIDKPSGWLSVPTSHSNEKSIIDEIQKYLNKKLPEKKAHAVHRLDRFASGVLVFAKSLEAKELLMTAFQERKIDKTYFALIHLHEVIDEQEKIGEIEMPIDDNRPNSKVICGKGKPARTEYEILKQKDHMALVKASAKTGRRHQVRVHFSETIGPILGDHFYGKKALSDSSERLMLHCQEIKLNHPHGGKRISIRSDLPAEFNSLLSNK